MINLLPPDVKQQVAYSRLNARLFGYVWLLVLTVLICGGLYGYSYYHTHRALSAASLDIANKQKQIDQFKDIEVRAKAVNDRVTAIKNISASQSHFSMLLNELARYTPKTVVIQALTLTGDDKKSVRITATADSKASIASFRDALETAPRISGADIENISYNDTDKSYTTSIAIGFKPGKAK